MPYVPWEGITLREKVVAQEGPHAMLDVHIPGVFLLDDAHQLIIRWSMYHRDGFRGPFRPDLPLFGLHLETLHFQYDEAELPFDGNVCHLDIAHGRVPARTIMEDVPERVTMVHMVIWDDEILESAYVILDVQHAGICFLFV